MSLTGTGLIIDLVEDWRQIMLAKLTEFGFSVTPTERYETVGAMYFNAMKRRIQPRPRNVVRAADFTTPPQFISVVDAIQTKFETGVDLRPHLSRKIVKVNAKDLMMYEWGIHHLHLSLTPNPRYGGNLVMGTKELLFAYVTTDTAYFLAILDHTHWSNQQLIQVVWDNWPDLLRPFVFAGALDVSYNPSQSERANLRKANINTTTKLRDGEILGPPGLGFQSDGTSTQVMLQVIRARKDLQAIEEFLRSEECAYRLHASLLGLQFSEQAHFQLVGTDEVGPIIIEVSSGYMIPDLTWAVHSSRRR